MMPFTITIDSADPPRLVGFWAEALGYTSAGEYGEFWPLFPTNQAEPLVVIQKVQEPKAGKNRMHLDLQVSDLDAEVRRLRELGATSLSEPRVEFDHRWVVMADPEGNEFCVDQHIGGEST